MTDRGFLVKAALSLQGLDPRSSNRCPVSRTKPTTNSDLKR